jgi:hypothetical protein
MLFKTNFINKKPDNYGKNTEFPTINSIVIDLLSIFINLDDTNYTYTNKKRIKMTLFDRLFFEKEKKSINFKKNCFFIFL